MASTRNRRVVGYPQDSSRSNNNATAATRGDKEPGALEPPRPPPQPLPRPSLKPGMSLSFSAMAADAESRLMTIEKAKNLITELDRDYRSTKDPLRSELYTGLKRLFKIYPGKYRMILEDMPEDRYEAFLKPRPGLEKLKAWDYKDKVQKVLRHIEFKNMDNRTVLYSMAATVHLVYMAKDSGLQEWTTCGLVERTDAADVIEQLPNRDYGSALKAKLADAAERLEEDFVEDGGDPVLFYVNRKAEGEFIYFGIRRQVALKPVKPSVRASKQKTKKVCSRSKETAEMLTLMVQKGLPHFFMNGYVPEYKIFLKVFVKTLGYKHYKKQNLSGKDVNQLVQTCQTPYSCDTLQSVNKQFKADEAELNLRQIYFGSCSSEIDRRFQIAQFRGLVPKSVPEPVTSDRKNAGTQTIAFTSAKGKSTIKYKGTVVELDEYIIECYKQRYIVDLTPFITLKKEQANSCHLQEKENLQA